MMLSCFPAIRYFVLRRTYLSRKVKKQGGKKNKKQEEDTKSSEIIHRGRLIWEIILGLGQIVYHLARFSRRDGGQQKPVRRQLVYANVTNSKLLKCTWRHPLNRRLGPPQVNQLEHFG